jgi:ABC-type uncharacterized transport system substrate-binding protein
VKPRRLSRVRAWAALLAVLCLASLPAARAGEKKILILRSGDFPIYDFATAGFKEGLALRKISSSIDEKTLPKDDPGAAAIQQSLRSSPPDLVFTVGTMATRFMIEKGGGIPHIYAMIVDPPSMGLTTGGAVMEVSPEAQVEFIRTYFPAMKRIGVIHSAVRNKESVRVLQGMRGAGLVMIQAETPEDVSKAIQRLSVEADCLLMLSDAVLYSPQTATQVILQTIQNNLPIFAVSPSFVKAGALAAVYPDYKDNGLLAAEAAARYFNGESLERIPMMWASRTHIAVNLVVAKHLGVNVPARAIELAQEVTK